MTPEDPEEVSHRPSIPNDSRGGDGKAVGVAKTDPRPLYFLSLPSAPGCRGLLLNPFVRAETDPLSREVICSEFGTGPALFPSLHSEAPNV